MKNVVVTVVLLYEKCCGYGSITHSINHYINQ